MKLTEAEMRMVFQIESTNQNAALNEIYMTWRYAPNPATKETAESLLEKLRPLSDQECMDIIRKVQTEYRLPENWDYTMKGLARICKDGIDSISGGIRELEAHGYMIRARVRGANGQLGSIEYTILEQPKSPSPTQEKPIQENPVQANPMLDAPIQENPAQLNKEESSNDPSKTDLSITHESNPIQSNPPTPAEARMGTDRMGARECYREVILDNIEYSYLVQDSHIDREQLDEIVDLIVDTVCSARKVIRIAGDDYPAEVVKSRFMKLDSSHVQYVMDCMKDNTSYVRNIKKYLLAALYNAPTTINSYYSSLVQHDMYGDGQRGRG